MTGFWRTLRVWVGNVEIYHVQFHPLYRYTGRLQDNGWHPSCSVICKETIRATNSFSTCQQKKTGEVSAEGTLEGCRHGIDDCRRLSRDVNFDDAQTCPKVCTFLDRYYDRQLKIAQLEIQSTNPCFVIFGVIAFLAFDFSDQLGDSNCCCERYLI
jgi:hypothetical protein